MSAGGGEDAGVDFGDAESAPAMEDEVIARLNRICDHDADEEDMVAKDMRGEAPGGKKFVTNEWQDASESMTRRHAAT
jgi:hypothetical protein